MTRKRIPVRRVQGTSRLDRTPWDDRQIGSEWDQGFQHALQDPWAAFNPAVAAIALTTPALQLVEHRDQIMVRALVPDANPGKLGVEVRGNRLTVSGRCRRDPSVERYEEYFRRTGTLPGPVDPARASAEYADGLLVVTLPRKDWRGRKGPWSGRTAGRGTGSEA